VEQLVRPTGLLEPTIEVKPTSGQIDDLLDQVRQRVGRGERCLVTTLTKRMAEELADYLIELGVKTHYLHSEIETLERVEILRDLRLGVYDVGYLRSSGALIQTMGRAARHIEGHVIMYADNMTRSMKAAIEETQRRRKIQETYNEEHDITPLSISKVVRDITERVQAVAETRTPYVAATPVTKEEVARLIKDLESQMKAAARSLEFEKAALLRDRIIELRRSQDERSLVR